ncbi:uncharacterized protein LOC130190980 isoform X2 [Pseudoliparis swirei]|nr:uncharacterized protein LOC130190980 isoform X2 [Pseudoliparis swirei]
MSEGREVTTVNFYLRNVLQFLGYLQDTPPSACRLRKAQINGIVRALDKALENLSGLIVTHQLQVKTNKMGRIVSRESLRRCQEQARLVIPELLTEMETDAEYNLRDDFYGYFLAFVVSIYGHRPGVLANMTVSEVEAAKKDRLLPTDSGYVITINEHRPNKDGRAQIFLTFEEFSWLERWLEVRKHLDPKNQKVLVSKGDGPVKNMVRYLQMAWAQMGLPGRPTFTDLRMAVSAHAQNVPNKTTRKQLARFMCHNTPTADGFDPLVLDRSQAKELRRQFEEVTASSSSSHAATKEGHRAPRQGSWKAEDASEDSGDSAAEEEEEAAEMEEERLENEAVEEEDQESTLQKKKPRRTVVLISPLQRAKELYRSRHRLVNRKR